MTREAKMKEMQMLDDARRKFMSYTQQQKETELAKLDGDIRRKVGDSDGDVFNIYIMLFFKWRPFVSSVEEIHSVGTINNIKISYFMQLKYVT